MRLGTVTITVKPASTPDWEGNPTNVVPPFPIAGCKKWPELGVEDTSRGEDVLARRGVWMPPGSPTVTALDTVTMEDRDWAVEGPPMPFQSAKGVDRGTIMYLRSRGAK